MFEQFYGLTADPFRLTPGYSVCFSHKNFSRARDYMVYTITRREGVAMITGEPGTGKTTLINDLRTRFIGGDVDVGLLVNTQLEVLDLLRMIADAFGITPIAANKAMALQQLVEFWKRQKAADRRALLIVDEAQDLPYAALEELRLLTNLEYEGGQLVQILLVGQEPLRDMIRSPQMRQLHQRIVAAWRLRPLEPQETIAYVRHRLEAAGWHGDPAFAAGIFRVIHEYSQGIPRLINVICNRLLLYGFIEERHLLQAADAELVAQELREEDLGPPVEEVPLIDDGEPDSMLLDLMSEEQNAPTAPEGKAPAGRRTAPETIDADQWAELDQGLFASSDPYPQDSTATNPEQEDLDASLPSSMTATAMPADSEALGPSFSQANSAPTGEPLGTDVFHPNAADDAAAEPLRRATAADPPKGPVEVASAQREGHGITESQPPSGSGRGKLWTYLASGLILVGLGILGVKLTQPLPTPDQSPSSSESVTQSRAEVPQQTPVQPRGSGQLSIGRENQAKADPRAPSVRPPDRERSAEEPSAAASEAPPLAQPLASSERNDVIQAPGEQETPKPSASADVNPAQPTGNPDASPTRLRRNMADTELKAAQTAQPPALTALESSPTKEQNTPPEPPQQAQDQVSVTPADDERIRAATEGISEDSSTTQDIVTADPTSALEGSAEAGTDLGQVEAAAVSPSAASLKKDQTTPGPPDSPSTVLTKRVFFEFDSTAVRGQFAAALDEVVTALGTSEDRSAEITGFTDAHGNPDYNLSLSRRRAESVAEYLMEGGVSKDRLIIEGRGPQDRAHQGGETNATDSQQRMVRIRVFQATRNR